ncbi:MAG: preprotein translocase subunit SecG [Parvibaculum sp.]|uniref:preprotein translocase subunit SecG n=1 Tax=Parvibaculum sp. TaxID=2024848 RepID=UPI001D2F8ED7|nr:preprotein translocase subunit SecG [Parvibaculum sp.]MBX3487809.1 preprotein translocase subunit SecG [Parvibaculum sp.]MBX3497208.1 preprotein translocase subunit SecG [Parvibaculum sp.]MCW5729046.1 preprotein translocase subunit SecG [Parvibaculum sp.]
MATIILIVHLMIAIALVASVLLQRSEGGALGIGGGGDGFVSSRGAGSMLTRTTAILAAMFMTTSLVLGILASRGGSADSVLDRVAPAPQTLSDDDLPQVPAPLGTEFAPAEEAPAAPEPAEPSVPRAE